jgi:hypothetical protein
MSASISSTEKRSRGRPRTNPVPQHFTMPRDLSEAVDAWIAAHPEPRPTRPEAIRCLLAEALAKAPLLPEIGEQTDAGPPPVDNTNLDGLGGLRRAIMAWVSEWRRDDPDIDDAAIAIYEEAANDLVTNPNLDLSFGYWIQSELDKLVRQKRKGAGHVSRKRRSQDQPTLKDSSGSEE